MTIHDVVQGSDEWKSLRRKLPTASNFDRIVTPKTGVLSASHNDYLNELIAACYVEEDAPFFENFWMKRGKEYEADAKRAFADHTGFQLKDVGFVTHSGGVLGCSPDSLILDDAGKIVSGLECKVPAPFTHIGYIREGVLPDVYKLQVHGSMAACELQEWHFWSFYPNLQPFHVRVEWDSFTDKCASVLLKFADLYKAEFERTKPLLQLPSNAE